MRGVFGAGVRHAEAGAYRDRQVALFPAPRRPDLAGELLAKLLDERRVLLAQCGALGLERHRALRTTSLQPESLLVLDGAPAEPLGTPDQGNEIVAWLELRATAALCALAMGVCAEALRLTAEYTKTRKQFDQPIATFQAVAQRAADAFIDTEAVRLTAFQAAWRIDAGLPAEAAVAAAKVWAAQGGSRVVRAAQHLHGGVGVDREYALHRYYL